MALISNFFVHGKPFEGESTATDRFDGLEEQITKKFFRSSYAFKDKSFMICEVRKWKEVFYSVYSLFKDGRDSINRPNGYSVLTLVVEGMYCIMPSHVYNLLEFVYKRGLQESLKVIDNSGRHLISSYSDKENEFGQLAKEVYERLDEKDFREIDFSISEGIPKVLRVNPIDADCESSLIVLRRHEGNLLVSKDFPTVEQEMKSLRKEPMRLEQQLASLRNEKKSLSEKNESLQGEVTALREQLAKVNEPEHPVQPLPEPAKPIGYEELRKTRDALKELANQIREMLVDFKNRKKPEPDSGNLLGQFSTFIKATFRFFPFLNSILLCVCLCGIFLKDASCSTTLFNSDSTKTTVEVRNDKKETGLQQEIKELKKQEKELSNKLNTLKEPIKAIFEGAQIMHSWKTTQIPQNESVDLKLDLKNKYEPCNSHVVWKIVEGKDIAKIEGNSLTAHKKGKIKVIANYCGVQIAERDIEIK